MAQMRFEDILAEIRKGIFRPVYFLMGDEAYYIDVIADFLEEKVLTDTEKEFDLTILYGKEIDVFDILNNARRYPMIASHHLVIVREAQNIKDIEGLLPFVQKPVSSTILVICYKYKTFDRRKKIIKDIEKHGLVFEGKKLYDNQLPEWISNYVKRKGYRIGPEANQMLADHLGADLGKIANELGKVFINLNKGGEITTRLIEENIGISKDYNVFELQKALGVRNGFKCHQIAKYFAENPKANPLVMTLGVLYQYFAKLMIYHSLPVKDKRSVAVALGVPDFFVPEYQRAASNYSQEKLTRVISYLRQCDIRSKGIDNQSISHGDLLKELIYKILHN